MCKHRSQAAARPSTTTPARALSTQPLAAVRRATKARHRALHHAPLQARVHGIVPRQRLQRRNVLVREEAVVVQGWAARVDTEDSLRAEVGLAAVVAEAHEVANVLGVDSQVLVALSE